MTIKIQHLTLWCYAFLMGVAYELPVILREEREEMVSLIIMIILMLSFLIFGIKVFRERHQEIREQNEPVYYARLYKREGIVVALIFISSFVGYGTPLAFYSYTLIGGYHFYWWWKEYSIHRKVQIK